MPRIRQRPIHPFIQEWMDQKGYANLKDASEKSGIPVSTLTDWADGVGYQVHLERIQKAAEAFKMPIEEWIEGMMKVS